MLLCDTPGHSHRLPMADCYRRVDPRVFRDQLVLYVNANTIILDMNGMIEQLNFQ